MPKLRNLVIFGSLALLAMWSIFRTKSATVFVADVRTRDVTRVISAVGRVRAVDQVSVRSLVAGKVLTITKDDGDAISLGETLITIDDELALQALKQVQAQLSIEKRNLEQRRKEKTRAEKLFNSKAIAVQAFELAQVAERESTENVARLTAAVAEANRQLREFTITAPFDGFVRRRLIDVGQAITLTTDLLEIVRSGAANALDIECEIDETFSNKITLGQEVSWQPSGVNALTYQGVISYISPTVDPRTGGFIIRITPGGAHGAALNSTPAPSHSAALPTALPTTLRPGQSVDVNIVVDQLQQQITIPRRAITKDGGIYFVWKVVDSTARRTLVKIDEWPEGDIVVTSGLSENEAVIVKPGGLSEGQRIKPVQNAL